VDSSSYNNAANQNFTRIGKLFAATLHVFQNQFDRFPDVGERFGDRLSLRVASGKRRANDHVAAILRIRFKKDLEIMGGHR